MSLDNIINLASAVFMPIQVTASDSKTSSPTLSQTPSPSTVDTKEGTPTPEKAKGGSISHMAGKCLHGLNNTVGKTLTPLVFALVAGAGGAVAGGLARVSVTNQKINFEIEYLKKQRGGGDAAGASLYSKIVRLPVNFAIGLFIGTGHYGGVITEDFGGMGAGASAGLKAAENLHGGLKEIAKEMKKH